MKFKYCNLQVKDLDDTKGIVQFYGSAFGNKDSDGDVIVNGAYTKTIQEKGPQGANRIKHLLQHKYDQIVGKILSVEQDSFGLLVESQLIDTSFGKDALEMYKHNLLEHSVGFRTVKGDFNKLLDAYEIKEIDLYEVSAVTWGANSQTPLVSMKSEHKIELATSLSKRMDSLIQAIRKGKFTDATFEALDIELLQIKAAYQSLIESLEVKEPLQSTPEIVEPIAKIDAVNIFKSVLNSTK
jgi:uncharacterized protein